MVDNLFQTITKERVSLLVLLELSAGFNSIHHGFLLGQPVGDGFEGSVLQYPDCLCTLEKSNCVAFLGCLQGYQGN